jgi:hypothetical protein
LVSIEEGGKVDVWSIGGRGVATSRLWSCDAAYKQLDNVMHTVKEAGPMPRQLHTLGSFKPYAKTLLPSLHWFEMLAKRSWHTITESKAQNSCLKYQVILIPYGNRRWACLLHELGRTGFTVFKLESRPGFPIRLTALPAHLCPDTRASQI